MATSFFDDPRMLAPPRTVKTDLGGGAFTLHSPDPLQPYARCVGEWLERWAVETPDAPAFGERATERGSAGGWVLLRWGELRQRVGSVAQALLDMNLPSAQPIVVLSDNALDHLVLLLAGMHIGRPVCTVSSGYCRLARGDYTKIHAILQALQPALVYASDAATYGPALQGCGVDAVAVFSDGAAQHPGALAFAQLLATAETPAAKRAFEAITPDSHAKYLLTSGSTGHPKVVINTHRMLCANQQMLAQVWCYLDVEKPVLLDWLPWSHTFGGNQNVNIVLRTGGTMYIDDGRPTPKAINKTIANLRDVQPTVYFNVPSGYDMMLPYLEADAALARHFFGRLHMLFYAGAGMPQSSWERLEALAVQVRDAPVWLTTSWGATETAPAITAPHWRLDRAGVIGLPLPGITLKFVPNGGKLEMRVRGANIFPGYRGNEQATRDAFDDAGYYRIGDAGYLFDEADPRKGIVFNGRVAEDFKLTTGTWVSVGTLRVKVVSALAPYVMDAVVTGHDRDEIGVLLFLKPEAASLSADTLATKVRDALKALRAGGGGSSQTPTRAMLLAEAPSAEAGEITDKGYINQRAVLARRASDVQALYAKPADSRVIFTQ
jgi:feruloyl-CoA synthase